MSRQLSPELSLVTACCRRPFDQAAVDAIGAALARGIDWSLCERIVYRNRVVALVYAALCRAGVELPLALADRLARRAQECAARSLVMAGESLRLQRAFDAAGLPLMVVKGAPLAILAYGELGLKESWDIDLLIRPADALRAADLMIDLGYAAPFAELTPGQRESYLTYGKDVTFVRTAPSIAVELHWRLNRNARLLHGIGAAGRGQDVPLPGGRLRTLVDDDLLIYLCVHGTYHNWSRLKWLADVGAMLGSRTPEELARLQAAAQSHGAGRCAAVALLLCRRLLGLSFDDALLRTLEGDRIVRMLVANAIAGLAHNRGVFEMRPYGRPWLRMMAGQFFAAGGIARGLAHIRLLWNAPDYRSSVTLPPGFEFGYHLVRVPLWFWRMSSRIIHGTRT